MENQTHYVIVMIFWYNKITRLDLKLNVGYYLDMRWRMNSTPLLRSFRVSFNIFYALCVSFNVIPILEVLDMQETTTSGDFRHVTLVVT